MLKSVSINKEIQKTYAFKKFLFLFIGTGIHSPFIFGGNLDFRLNKNYITHYTFNHKFSLNTMILLIYFKIIMIVVMSIQLLLTGYFPVRALQNF